MNVGKPLSETVKNRERANYLSIRTDSAKRPVDFDSVAGILHRHISRFFRTSSLFINEYMCVYT